MTQEYYVAYNDTNRYFVCTKAEFNSKYVRLGGVGPFKTRAEAEQFATECNIVGYLVKRTGDKC